MVFKLTLYKIISGRFLHKMSSSSPINMILSAFGKPDVVKIRDPSKVESLVDALIQGGAESLQVITDFDATLTRYHFNGKKCDSSYGIIANTALVPEEYRQKAFAMYEKYYPIEIDPNMTTEQKIPFMIEWYEQSHEWMVASEPRFRKQSIKEMVQKSTTQLRDNAKEMANTLHHHGVPMLVLSAGVGDIVQEVLSAQEIQFPNVKVISNFMEFDDEDLIKGFKEPLIHMYNKNEAAVHDENNKYFEDLKSRNSVILMGDCLGDANMDDGVPSPKSVLKIGFLNTKVEKLESFMAAFDIVLVDDQSMDFVNLLLKQVLKK